MKNYVVIWDWDNTLADTFEGWFRALTDLCARYNRPMLSRENLLKAIGGEATTFWNDCFTDDNRQEAIDFYYDRSAHHMQESARLFEDTVRALAWLKQHKIPQIIISNQMQWILDIECERLNIDTYFRKIVGRTDALKKPSMAFLNRALEGILYDKCLVVGDGLADMEMAKNLNGFGLLVRQMPPTPGMIYDKHVYNLNEALNFFENFFERGKQ